jgi:hypothetical protein
MRFLLDQDVYAVTIRFLGELGHDVVVAAEIRKSGLLDAQQSLPGRDADAGRPPAGGARPRRAGAGAAVASLNDLRFDKRCQRVWQ